MPNVGPANSNVTNIVPVQGIFDVSGNCVSLIGPSGVNIPAIRIQYN